MFDRRRLYIRIIISFHRVDPKVRAVILLVSVGFVSDDGLTSLNPCLDA